MPTLIENKTLADNIHLCKRPNLQFIELNTNFPEHQIDKLNHSHKLRYFHIHDIQLSRLLCYIKLNECVCQHSYHSV